MRNRIVLIVLGAIVLLVGTVEATGGWYTYAMLSPAACAAFKNGHYAIEPGRIVPGQPNECYIQTPRFSWP